MRRDAIASVDWDLLNDAVGARQAKKRTLLRPGQGSRATEGRGQFEKVVPENVVYGKATRILANETTSFYPEPNASTAARYSDLIRPFERIKMIPLVRRRFLAAVILPLVTSPPTISLAAGPNEIPLAKASDIDFTIEYSTGKLMLGDILYARVTIRNKADHVVQITGFDGLVISAETPMAKEIVCGFGEYASGFPLLKLMPGQEIVYSRILDVFGNDGDEDGHFEPFDQALDGQEVVLHARRATLTPHQMGDSDYRQYVMKHEQVIHFGPPLIAKAAFDEAVVAKLKSENLEPLKLNFDYFQTSYLFTLKFDLLGQQIGPRTFAACLDVMSRELPVRSSARRAASIILQINRFVDAAGDAEDQAISSVLSLIAEGPVMEQRFWRDYLLSKGKMYVIGSATETVLSREKYNLLSERMAELNIAWDSNRDARTKANTSK